MDFHTAADASGGYAVAEGNRLFGRPRTPFVLAHGPDLRIGRGDYVAEFTVRIDCGEVGLSCVYRNEDIGYGCAAG